MKEFLDEILIFISRCSSTKIILVKNEESLKRSANCLTILTKRENYIFAHV